MSLTFVYPIPKEITCVVCLNLCFYPCFHSKDSNVIKCIKCPTPAIMVDEWINSEITESYKKGLNNLRVNCPNYNNGCMEVLSYQDVTAHIVNIQ